MQIQSAHQKSIAIRYHIHRAPVAAFQGVETAKLTICPANKPSNVPDIIIPASGLATMAHKFLRPRKVKSLFTMAYQRRIENRSTPQQGVTEVHDYRQGT